MAAEGLSLGRGAAPSPSLGGDGLRRHGLEPLPGALQQRQGRHAVLHAIHGRGEEGGLTAARRRAALGGGEVADGAAGDLDLGLLLLDEAQAAHAAKVAEAEAVVVLRHRGEGHALAHGLRGGGCGLARAALYDLRGAALQQGERRRAAVGDGGLQGAVGHGAPTGGHGGGGNEGEEHARHLVCQLRYGIRGARRGACDGVRELGGWSGLQSAAQEGDAERYTARA
mmetsp:Transcript_69423/g.194688  ORF Transcript_69423/g.194688 Transcript_69423/m.194688 type:complete len:226 (+) Transcript_69423:96-773(+)